MNSYREKNKKSLWSFPYKVRLKRESDLTMQAPLNSSMQLDKKCSRRNNTKNEVINIVIANYDNLPAEKRTMSVFTYLDYLGTS